MTLVKVNSVTPIYRAQVQLLTVTVNDSGKTGFINVTNSDETVILVPFTASTTVTLTRAAVKIALEADAQVAALYTMADVSTDGVSMTQIFADGVFDAQPKALGGTLALTSATTTTATHTLPRHRLNLASPVAGSTGDIYVSRNSLRACSGEYALVSDAVTSATVPSITVEDTNGLLAPTPGPFAANESSGYMDDGFTTAKNGPDWVKDWILNKEELEIGAPVAVEVADVAYTILSSDKTVFLSTTTSAGNFNLTFGTGVDGQEVTCVFTAKSGTDEYAIVGIEGLTDNLAAANDCFTAVYDAAGDKWYLKANLIA